MRLRPYRQTAPTARQAAVTIAAIVTAAAGCGGSDSVVPPAPVAQISVTLDSTPTVGYTRQAAAIANDANGARITNPALSWSSSDTTVAWVSPTGAISGTGVGSAVISATAGTVTATLPVSIAPSVTVVSSSAAGRLLGVTGRINDAGTFLVALTSGVICDGGSPASPSAAIGSASSPLSYTPLATNPCADSYSITAINAGGTLAGYHGFAGIPSYTMTWHAGIETQLRESPAGSAPSHANAIDDAGDVVGDVTVPYPGGGFTQGAALWPHGGSPVLLQTPSGSSSSATGIDTHGEIVGWSYVTAEGGDRALLWTTADQAPATIATPTGYGTADGISSNGQFIVGHSENVGTHTTPGMCYLWSRATNTATDLGNFEGGRVEAVAVDDAGEVIANLRGVTSPEGVFRTRTGALVSLGQVRLTGINNTGLVVGSANSSVYLFRVHASVPAR